MSHALAMTFRVASMAITELVALDGERATPEWLAKWGGPDVFKLRPDLAPPNRSAGTNIMEATDPFERPREAIRKLQDLADWLASDGHQHLAGDAKDLADNIDACYPEAV